MLNCKYLLPLQAKSLKNGFADEKVGWLNEKREDEKIGYEKMRRGGDEKRWGGKMKRWVGWGWNSGDEKWCETKANKTKQRISYKIDIFYINLN